MFWNYAVLGHWLLPSDIWAVMLFTAGLNAAWRRNWTLFYCVFLIGALNRETIIFLTVAYLLAFSSRQHLLTTSGHAIAQLAIWLAVKSSLYLAFLDHAGKGVFETQWQRNLRALTTFNDDSVKIACAFGLIWTLIPLAWPHLPREYKRLLWVILPFVGSMAVVAVLAETRIYSELVPLIAAPALLALCENGDRRRSGIRESVVDFDQPSRRSPTP
jgi:hypothetical protein